MQLNPSHTSSGSAKSVDVTFALTGDPKINSRALRQLKLLSDLDLSIRVLGLGSASATCDLNLANVTLEYLPRPIERGPRFFWQVHRQLMAALRNVTSRIFHASDLYTLPALHWAAARQQVPVVFDSRELYTHLPAAVRRPWIGATWKILQQIYIRRAHCIYTVSGSIAAHLEKQYGLSTVHVMRNVPGPQHSMPGPCLRTRLDLPPETKLILHQGNLQPHRGISTMISAMRSVEQAVLVFLGGGPLRSQAKQLVQDLNLESKVHFLDAVAPDQLLSVTASADLGLILLDDCCLNHQYALPNKLFEYLSAGVPVIASDLFEITRILQRFDVGCVVPSGDVAALETALRHAVKEDALRQKWAQNTSRVQEFYNFVRESEHFLAPYRRLINR